MASKKQNTLLKLVKPKENQGKNEFIKILILFQ